MIIKQKNSGRNFLLKQLIGAALLLLCLASCSRKYELFRNSSTANSPYAKDKNQKDSLKGDEKVLAPNDKITISIWDHEDLSVGSVHSIYSLIEENGKWLAINSKGEVNLPQIGVVKLGGLSVREATVFLGKQYSKFIQNPIINIRILNNQVTVLGEVRKQGNYIFSEENIKLVDLIAKAEGFTDYARTNKIKIVKAGEDAKPVEVDFTDSHSLKENEAIIQPGDVVYVPPSKAKGVDRFTSKLIPFASLITAFAIFYSVAK